MWCKTWSKQSNVFETFYGAFEAFFNVTTTCVKKINIVKKYLFASHGTLKLIKKIKVININIAFKKNNNLELILYESIK